MRLEESVSHLRRPTRHVTQLFTYFNKPHSGSSSSISDSHIPSPITSSCFVSPLSSSVIPTVFHYRLKTYLFHKSFPVVSLLPPGLPSRIVSSELIFSFLVPCVRFSWLSRQLLSACKYAASYRIVGILWI